MTADDAAAAFALAPDRRHWLRVVAEERIGDDVHLDVRVQVSRYSAHAAATATTVALAAWRSELQALYDELAGRAVLRVEGLELELAAAAHGRLDVTGRVLTPAPLDGWGDADLRFSLPGVDQTFLPPVLAGVDRALALPDVDAEDEG